MSDMPAIDGPATSVTEAIARMEAIEASLPPTDGMACFNLLDTLAASTALASRILLVAV